MSTPGVADRTPPSDPAIGPVRTEYPEVQAALGRRLVGVDPFLSLVRRRHVRDLRTVATFKTTASATRTCSRPATRCHTRAMALEDWADPPAGAGGAASRAGPQAGHHPGAAGVGVPHRRAGLRARARPPRSGQRHLDGRAGWCSRRADVAVGLRMLARLARRSSVWWILGSAAWGGLSTALLAFLAAKLTHGIGGGRRGPCCITGSSSGIGRAAAERFAARGWRVFASMRRQVAGAPLAGAGRREGVAG